TILAFGLAVLYSASSMSAVQEHRSNAFYLLRQLSGVGIGIVAFAIAAKMDAERWYKWAWPVMGVTLTLMLITILPFTRSIAPMIHGSRRFLIGASIQPSEIGRFAVVIWSGMLVVKNRPQRHRVRTGSLRCHVVGRARHDLFLRQPYRPTARLHPLLNTVIPSAGG